MVSESSVSVKKGLKCSILHLGGWSGGWMSCSLATARRGEGERAYLGWFWSCPSSSSSLPLPPDFPLQAWPQLVLLSLVSRLALLPLIPSLQHSTAKKCPGYCKMLCVVQRHHHTLWYIQDTVSGCSCIAHLYSTLGLNGVETPAFPCLWGPCGTGRWWHPLYANVWSVCKLQWVQKSG